MCYKKGGWEGITNHKFVFKAYIRCLNMKLIEQPVEEWILFPSKLVILIFYFNVVIVNISITVSFD